MTAVCFRVIAEELTSFYDDVGMRCERDAFDTLFDHAPDKLQVSHYSFYTQRIPPLQCCGAGTMKNRQLQLQL